MKNLMTPLFIFALAGLIAAGCNPDRENGAPDRVEPDIRLEFDISANNSQKLGWRTYNADLYTHRGEPYTGKQTFYYQRNGVNYRPFLTRTFVDGMTTKWVMYDDDGNPSYVTKYDVRDGQVVKIVEYNPDGQKRYEAVHPSVTDDGIGYAKEWHENGELKATARIDADNNYVGLMTLRDKQGEILKQKKF